MGIGYNITQCYVITCVNIQLIFYNDVVIYRLTIKAKESIEIHSVKVIFLIILNKQSLKE